MDKGCSLGVTKILATVRGNSSLCELLNATNLYALKLLILSYVTIISGFLNLYKMHHIAAYL